MTVPSGPDVVMGGGQLRRRMAVVLEEYKILTDGSGADTSAVRQRVVDEWLMGGGKGRKKRKGS
jgi:hypothetical protein